MTALIAAVDKKIADFPQTVESRQLQSGDVAKQLQAMLDKGYKIVKLLARHQAAAAKLQAHADEGEVQEGLSRMPAIIGLDQVAELLKGIKADAKALIILQGEVNQSIVTLEVRIGTARQKAKDAHDAFARVEANFAPACWEESRDDDKTEEGQTFDDLIAGVVTVLVSIKELAGMKVQDWDTAKVKVAAANTTLEVAESLAALRVKLETDLIATRDGMAGKIRMVREFLQGLEDYIGEHRDDIDAGPDAELIDGRSKLAEAEAEAAKESHEEAAAKPDYPAVQTSLDDASAAGHRGLDSAKRQFKAAEDLRNAAADALQGASNAIAEAERYISSNSDVGSEATRLLTLARTQLASARGLSDLHEVIRAANTAESTANSAKSSAEADVRAAEAAEAARLAVIAQAERDRRAREQREQEDSERRAAASITPSGGDDDGGRHGNLDVD